MSNSRSPLATALQQIRETIAETAAACGRQADDIHLTAIAKRQPLDRIETALALGLRRFGENQVQEAVGKWPALLDRFPETRLHMVGALQTNKVREACGLFHVIESLDRAKLAEALARERDKTGACPDLLVQVNTGEEEQKSGVRPRDLATFLRQCREDLALPVKGLMVLPPANQPPFLHFALLAELAAAHALTTLSMGMSGDYETAIRFGATHIRIGSGLFGMRVGKT